MKKYFSKILIGIALLTFAACSDILDEQPRSVLTPGLFRTEEGLISGLNGAYNGLRYITGTEAIMYSTVLGTDEFTAAASCGTRQLDMDPDNSGTGIDAGTNSINIPFQFSFSFINSCNGIIEYGTEAGLDEDLIAEAYFLRGYYYFILVQMYGGLPLDLGSGSLKYNTTPTTLSARNTTEEVYQAIIADLQHAEEYLPVEPRLPGCAKKASAIHFLAKVYLTHGDNQLALTEAEKLLNPTAPYTVNEYGVALLPSYSDVIRPANERNAEIMFTCEHTETYAFNETAQGYGSGTVYKDDRSISYFVPNYPTWRLDTVFNASPVVRSTPYSRPWIRLRATAGLLADIFEDKTNDSRFDATFQTVWLNNNVRVPGPLSEAGVDTVWNNPGDTAFVMILSHDEVSQAYRDSKNYRIWTLSQTDRSFFPALKKFFDPNRQDMNDASGRPFLLAKLSETYLIAAEAAVNLTDNTKARNYILVLRERAAKEGHEQDMIDATPATITIDYILDERSRELCGEQMRWFDLVRTGKWRERSSTYSLNGVDMLTRNIEAHYDLRPIPQNQIDLMGNTAAEKRAYQNPGYPADY